MDFEKEWTRINPEYVHLLKKFREALEVDKIEFGMMTVRNLTIIREYLAERMAGNSVVTYCAILKAFLAQFSDTDALPCGDAYKKALKAQKMPSEQVVLTEEEMSRIDDFVPTTKTGKVLQAASEVKARFMCEYYSLARSSDIDNFTDENIDTEKRLITYVSKKTKKKAIVPLHEKFLRYYRQRGTKKYSKAYYNHTMKEICRRCGITQPVKVFYRGKEQTMEKCELVGSHTARRSGATNLAKRGTPIPLIAKMMSHGQDVQMTQRYIWIDEISLDEKSAAFFF